jgi:hypothetical protein
MKVMVLLLPLPVCKLSAYAYEETSLFFLSLAAALSSPPIASSTCLHPKKKKIARLGSEMRNRESTRKSTSINYRRLRLDILTAVVIASELGAREREEMLMAFAVCADVVVFRINRMHNRARYIV